MLTPMDCAESEHWECALTWARRNTYDSASDGKGFRLLEEYPSREEACA